MSDDQKEPSERDIPPQRTAPAAPVAPAAFALPAELPAERDGTAPPEGLAAVDPAASPEAGAAGRTPRCRGRIAAVVGCVLLAGALVAGVGCTVVAVHGADRDAGAPTWKFPKESSGKGKAAAERHGLAGMLVPYGTDSWVRGPDIAQFGSDAELSGAQATALRKESVSGLPGAQRRLLERQIDRERVKGMAMRSYFSGGTSPSAWNDGIYAVDLFLSRMENRAAVRTLSTSQNTLLGALGMRQGPKIKGHENTECFRTPKGTAKDLDTMFCSGYVGDVLVTATADSVHPIDAAGVAELLRIQLDRIAEPGEAV
ncbi:hypothetical protein [Streptomyces bungoensis]|uniref:hypothetical protein n=1 Tax=Streptomyces bungoensis TaxID=285568 RepID=UPI003428309F